MNRSQRLLVSLCILTFIPFPLLPQRLPSTSLEEVGLSSKQLERLTASMQGYVDDNRLAGIVGLVARKGRVVYQRSFGMADKENNKPMTNDAIFRIASMTKPITSVAVMILYEEGHFLLNEPVSRYIPEFKDSKVLVPNDSTDSTNSAYTLVPSADSS